MGCDTFGAPQKTIRNPEPDGPSGPGTTKLVQRSTEAPEPVPGRLSDPLDAAVAVVMRLDCLGGGRASSQLKTGGSGLEQTCQKRILDAFPVCSEPLMPYRRVPRDAPGPRWVV